MYGHLNVIIKAFVRQRFGEDAWKKIASKSGCGSDFKEHAAYDDEMTQRILEAAAAGTGFKRDVFLEMMGEFYLDYVRRIGHDELLRNLGENILDFIENLDYVHTYMMSEFPDINMPSFRCEAESSKDKMTLHYYSFRQGYHPLVVGILRAAAKTYYGSELTMEVISKTMEEVRTKKGSTSIREHVVFAIMVVKGRIVQQEEGPPTFIAQTRKHGEKQIIKKDIDRVLDRLEQIRREEGEDALPLNRYKAIQAKWKTLAKMSVLFGGFVAQYPLNLSVTSKTFCNAFPFHVVFNSSMNLVHSGVKLQQIMPGIRSTSARMELFFEVLHPHSVDFTFDNVCKFINTPFVMKTKTTKMVNTWGTKPMLILRGQMLHMTDENLLIFLCSPFVRCLNDLETRGMYLADIPMHDVTRDMLWMELMGRYKRGSGGQGHKGGAANNNDKKGQGDGGLVVLHSSPLAGFDPAMAADVDGLRRALQKAQAELEEERRKNYWLYHAFLPPTTVEQLANGQQPDAGEYNPVTVLFSDVVAFSQIIQCCKPNDVVNLLTQLHAKFDHVCMVHETYRVESIGDAYMVVSGMPDRIFSHSERIANTALGMLISAREVMSPYDYGDKTRTVKVRLGIHTGKVYGGVVGENLPRYLVLGETVNLASKMESHGVPGKIQISPVTQEQLKGKGYRLEKRSGVEVRGRGKMHTYFLLGNNNVTDDDIMGRRPRKNYHGNEVTFINEGKEQPPPKSTSTNGSWSPMLSRNRVRPGHDSSRGSQNSRPDSAEGDDFVPMMYRDGPRYPLDQGRSNTPVPYSSGGRP